MGVVEGRRQANKDTHRQIGTKRQTGIHTDRQGQKDGQGYTQTDRDKKTDRDTHRQTGTKRPTGIHLSLIHI